MTHQTDPLAELAKLTGEDEAALSRQLIEMGFMTPDGQLIFPRVELPLTLESQRPPLIAHLTLTQLHVRLGLWGDTALNPISGPDIVHHKEIT